MPIAESSTSVNVSVTINAEPETVWKFLSEQDRFLSWMSFIPGSPTPPGSTFEARPGGTLRIIFPNGGEAKGKVVELDRPRLLVFTWGYDPDVGKTGLGPGVCRVEISLVRVAEGTRVSLTHRGPMSPDLAKAHEAGWKHYLSTLSRLGADSQHGPTLERLLADYFLAWNEHDESKRLKILLRCCDTSVHVRTQFACTDTIEELSAHIANGLKHMPGMSLSQSGSAQHLHGFVLSPWAVKAPNGAAAFAGENFMALSPRGRIVRVVGFPQPVG